MTALGEQGFEDRQLPFEAARRMDPFECVIGLPGAPERLERRVPAGQCVLGRAQQGSGGAGLKLGADGSGGHRNVAHVEGRARAADDRVAMGLALCVVGASEELQRRPRKPEHQVHAAGGQHMLARAWPFGRRTVGR